jgi:hypothetical protein
MWSNNNAASAGTPAPGTGQWTERLLRDTVEAVRTSNGHPMAEDFRMYHNNDEVFRTQSDMLASQALRLISVMADWISPDKVTSLEQFHDDILR